MTIFTLLMASRRPKKLGYRQYITKHFKAIVSVHLEKLKNQMYVSSLHKQIHAYHHAKMISPLTRLVLAWMGSVNQALIPVTLLSLLLYSIGSTDNLCICCYFWLLLNGDLKFVFMLFFCCCVCWMLCLFLSVPELRNKSQKVF